MHAADTAGDVPPVNVTRFARTYRTSGPTLDTASVYAPPGRLLDTAEPVDVPNTAHVVPSIEPSRFTTTADGEPVTVVTMRTLLRGVTRSMVPPGPVVV